MILAFKLPCSKRPSLSICVVRKDVFCCIVVGFQEHANSRSFCASKATHALPTAYEKYAMQKKLSC